MKKTLLTGIAALLLATGTAHALASTRVECTTPTTGTYWLDVKAAENKVELHSNKGDFTFRITELSPPVVEFADNAGNKRHLIWWDKSFIDEGGELRHGAVMYEALKNGKPTWTVVCSEVVP